MSIIHNLVARFRADTGAFDRNVKKSRTQMTRFGKDVQRMGRQLLAIAGIGGGIYAVKRAFESVTKAASDLQETQSKFNIVFRQLSDEANKWAIDFGNSVGRSETAVKSWMARLQDTFVPLGYAREEAMKMSKELVKLAVDVASFNNAADADVIRDFTSALVGNHETVRKYGILISENRLKQMALSNNFADSYRELTDLQKVQLRFNTLLADTSDAQGDAERTADEYANQVKRLKANWEELKTTIGKGIVPPTSKLITEINKILQGEKIYLGISGGVIDLSALKPVMPDIQEKFAKKRQEEADALMKAARDYQKILQEQGKPIIEQMEMMDEHREKIMKDAGSYQAMQERMARQAIETDIAVYTKQFEEAQRIQEREAEKIAENQRRIYTDIARGMAYEWSSAFDQMLFEGKKFAETMKDMLRGVARMVTQIVMYEKFAKPIAAAMMGVDVSELHSGGIVGAGGRKRNVPALAFAGAPRLHGGLMGDEYPAILQRGEQVIPRGGMAAPQINIYNESGTQLSQGGQPFFDGDKWVIRIVAKDWNSGGTLRKLMGKR